MNASCDEQALVRLYMDVTGASEPVARNVFMHICCHEPYDQCSGQNQAESVNPADSLVHQPEAPRRFNFATGLRRLVTGATS
jgi:hypothetical protein